MKAIFTQTMKAIGDFMDSNKVENYLREVKWMDFAL
jgi:hypothetical protein